MSGEGETIDTSPPTNFSQGVIISSKEREYYSLLLEDWIEYIIYA